MISDLRLQNFRSYGDGSFEFDQAVNIIVGPNASGKTNLLEALLVICLGSSYKARDIDMVRHKKRWARLDSHSSKTHRTAKIRISHGKATKDFEIDNKPFKRLSAEKTLPAVLFEPNHLRLLAGQPEKRRDFMDGLLGQTVPEYKKLLRQYKRALAQRNTLLKTSPKPTDHLFAWNIRLSELGGKIAVYRNGLAEEANNLLEGIYRKLAGANTEVTAKYECTFNISNYSSQMLKKLESSLDTDIERGFTASGPHRDDLVVKLNGHEVGETASRGETRTLLLGLKMIELKLIEQKRQQKPILLLDDVFSELDGARRKALTEFLYGYQAFITTTDADIVLKHFTESCRIIPMN